MGMDYLTLIVFLLASVILLIGFAGRIIFKKTNIPDIIWLLIFGILLSFFLSPEQRQILVSFAGPFGSLALMMILFNSGMEFDILQFSQGIPRGLLLSVVSFVLTSIGTAIIANLVIGWPLLYGLLLGIAVGGTSSGVVIPIITRLKVREYIKSVLTIESTATDIFVIVFAIAVIDIIAKGTTDLALALKSILAAFSIGITIGLFGALLWAYLLVKLEKEVRSYLLDFTIVMLLYVFTEFIGGAGAIAALTFGLVMGNLHTVRKLIKIPQEARLTYGERTFYSELNFFVRTFFFVYLGSVFSFSNLYLVGFGLLLVFFYMIIRFVSVCISVYKDNVSKEERNLMSVLMGRGLAAAVIAQAPLVLIPNAANHPIFSSFSSIVLSVILFSIVFTVVGVFYLAKQAVPQKKRPQKQSSQAKSKS